MLEISHQKNHLPLYLVQIHKLSKLLMLKKRDRTPSVILNGLEIYFYFNNPEIKNLNHKYIINIEEYANNKRESN